MPFVDFNELKGRANAARSSLATRADGVKTSAQSAYRNRTAGDAHAATEAHNETQEPRFHDPTEKQALFGLLDDYFARRKSGVRSAPRLVSSVAPSTTSRASFGTPRPTPPPTNTSTRPVLSSAAGPRPPSQSNLPVATPASSSSSTTPIEAQTLAQFFSPSTSWASYPEWFAFDRLPSGSQPTPPPLANREVIRSTSWSFHGNQKTLDGIVLFEDLSVTWYHLTWTEPRSVRREVKWTAPPSPWDGGQLYASSLAYGDLLAEFAEAAERDRRHVGRGECWDLANEGLQSIASQTSPPPMKCIGRTHGHLLFTARAGETGVWRGGENAIRRGDIVQWLSTKIKLVGQPNVTMTLGEPDHTAIVVSDTGVTGVDGPPGEDGLRQLDVGCIGPLEVVEQSVKELPTRRTYDMSTFSSGQVWIYRPVSMEAYVGIREVAPSWPPQVPPERLNGV